MADCPRNEIISKSIVKTNSIINNPKYNNPVCSISGGSDSDIMLDICVNCDKDNKIKYIWFDTGLEYQATKDHLKELEKEYGIVIGKFKAIKPIPVSCKEYGQPFISKQVSDFISRLQKHNFQWEDEPYEILLEKYKNCKSALQWWCCRKGENSWFDISRNRYLKEFMVENPPWFKISSKCCKYAKKDVAASFIKQNKNDLSLVGIRKSEGGLRSTLYKNCFDDNDGKKNKIDIFRPIFWYKNSDKIDYENAFDISHSRCYEEYGLKRTGCAGCPFNINFEDGLKIIEKYEPKLFKAVCNIFKDSYEYTRMYREFVLKQKNK